jgi:hypothetical protein
MRSAMLMPLFLFLVAVLAAACDDPTPSRLTATGEPAFAEHNICELGVSDQEALALIDGLIAAVTELEADGNLSSGQANALRNHLENARKHIEAGRYCPAIAQLNAFREQVENFVEDGVLEPEEAEPLLGGADDVIEGLPNRVTIDAPSPAAGTYGASGAHFGPEPTAAGVTGSVVLVNDGSAAPTLGCDSLIGFPAGAIALMDRGNCLFVQKVLNAQNAGAVAVIVINSVSGSPISLGGTSAEATIPAVMVSLDDGAVIKSGLPATGAVKQAPE